jgi:hypothetical protein
MAMCAELRECDDGRGLAEWTTDGAACLGRFRLAGLAGLLLIEVLALSLRYDARSLGEGVRGLSRAFGSIEARDGWIVRVFEHSGMAMKAGITAAAAMLLFGGHTLREGLGRAAAASPGRRSRRPQAPPARSSAPRP